MNNLNILLVDAVGPFGGASRSLFELCFYLKKNNHCNLFFFCTKGSSVNWFKKLSKNIIITRGLFRFDNTLHSHYRGLRWLILIREFSKIPSTIFFSIITFFRWRNRINIIHCNEITDIFPALLLKCLFRVPLFLHVRSVQSGNLNPLRTSFLSFVCNNFVNKVIFIDEIVKRSMPEIEGEVIYNSLNIYLSENQIKNMIVERRKKNFLNVVFLGNLQKAKGFNDLLNAFLIIKKRGFINIFLNVYGKNTYSRGRLWFFLLSIFGFSTDASSAPHKLIHEMGLNDFVRLNGYESNLENVFSDAHVLIFASHYDAPGRPVFEAGFFSVPSIVAIKNPTPDTFIPGESGLIVEAKDSNDLAEKIIYLNQNPDALYLMGANARKISLNTHSIDVNAMKLLSLYASFK